MLGGVVVCLYFGLIPISLEHRAHATTANAIWRGRITREKYYHRYIITPYPVPGSTETLTAPTICYFLPALVGRGIKIFGGW